MRSVAAIVLLCLTFPLMHSQQTTGPARASTALAATPEDAAATRADVQKMKALVQQMQTNLAFVTNTQGPLKHQFELEIEMWQLEIARMERKMEAEASKQ